MYVLLTVCFALVAGAGTAVSPCVLPVLPLALSGAATGGRRGPPRVARRRGDGFGSGVVLGASLGLLYVPCAGPVLAAVLTVQASQDLTAQRLVTGLAYALGTAGGVLVVLLAG